MKFNKPFQLVVSIVACELAGAVGSIFTTPSITTWYIGLAKPSLNPPNWVFAPVWTLLFLLMGIALYLVWQSEAISVEQKTQKRIAVLFFFQQLALNVLWSVLFFGARNPGLALAEIVVLWLAILITIVSFAKIFKTAAYLLLPYILWVSFAAYLNFYLWLLN